MEKVKVSISGHDFNLRSDNPERLRAAESELKKKISQISEAAAGMSLTDTVILSALDIADEAESAKNDCDMYKKQSEELKKQLEEYEQHGSNMKSAQEELSAAQDRIKLLETENNELIAENDKALALKEENAELVEKNKALENKLAQLETSWNNLKRDYARSHNKKDDVSGANEQEIAVLKDTVNTYEKTFDEYVKQKSAEIAELNDELNALKKKYSDLNQQMSEIVNDGQMTL
ncbi:MAG: cell division protein ZapA [Eubacterium sp.]|nr:cell division protein ZapA [Eubacterium sp.]